MKIINTLTYWKTYLLLLSIFLALPVLVTSQEIKIMPLGNSITYDNNVGDSRPLGDRIAYRYKLYQLLNGAGYSFDYVGSEDAGNNFFNDAEYDDNAGFPSITTNQLLTLMQTGKNPTDGNACLLPIGCDNNYIEYYAPDVILLHIGTNGLGSNADADNFIVHVENMLNEIDNVESTLGKPILVLLAQIINRQNGGHSPTSYYNGLIENLYNGRPSDHLILVDMENDAGINYSSDMIDTWHPTQSGYDKMGQLWFNKLDGFNSAPQISDIPNQSITEAEVQFDLDDFITDSETSDQDIEWTISPQNPVHYNVSISSSRVVTVTPKNGASTADETITFTATDNGRVLEGLKKSVSDDVTFSVNIVNNPPVISDVPGEAIPENSSFDNIILDNFVTDDQTGDENINWTFSPSAPTHVNVSINNRVASISAKNASWRGSETITFTATDEGGESDSDTAIFTVVEVNDNPVVSNISNQSIGESGSFNDINLDAFVSDEETPDNLINWSFSPASPQHLNVSINGNRVAGISVKDSEWRGSETITFTATDQGGLSDSDQVQFTVNEVNDPPVVDDIQDQSITDNGSFNSINLSNFVSDEETENEDIFWSYSPSSPTNLNVTISNKIATISVKSASWRGSETITFTATDEGGLQDSDDVTFTVSEENDAPSVSNIPDQTIFEGGSFNNINLNNFVNDEETAKSDIDWSISPASPVNFNVSIGANNVATISVLDAEWNGSETITFIATDEGGLQDSDGATFTVDGVNDPPQVSEIPDQSVSEGSDFQTINLNDYVSDDMTPDNEISWSTSPANPSNLNVSISGTNVATVTVKNENWNGQESITFVATDESGLSGNQTTVFEVTPINDPPVISDIPDMVTTEGTPFGTFDLDDYIDDVESSDSDISWSINPQTPVNFTINIAGNHVVTVTPIDENFNGDETITFEATDEDGATVSNDVTITVLPLNDPPQITDIEDQEVDEGEPYSSFVLDDYIFDLETTDENINWTLDPENPMYLDISIGPNRLVNIIAKDENWNGEETVKFIATDAGGLSVSDNATFRMLAVNDVPEVSDIPNQRIFEGQSFGAIDLDDYVTDIETAIADIQWTYSSSLDPSNLIVDISETHNVNVSVVDENWNGSETITFTAADEEDATDSDEVIFEVAGINDAPVISNIPDQTINEGESFQTIDLDTYIDDLETDDEDIEWTHSNPVNYDVVISSSRVATITPVDVEWNGSEEIIFTAEDEEGLFASDGADFTINPVNDPPVVGNIPGQAIQEGGSFAQFDLDNFVSDPDNSKNQLSWTYTPTSPVNLNVSINSANRVVNVSVKDADWNGSEVITFIAEDPGGLSDSDTAIFTVLPVNDPPVISNIPNEAIDEGDAFSQIILDDFVDDVETADQDIIWTYSLPTDPNLDVDITNRVATITPLNENWNGSETVTFTAEDEGGEQVSNDATFTVNPVNDLPVISDIPDQNADEGESFTQINLDNFIDDIETDDKDIQWTFALPPSPNLNVVINNRKATVTALDEDWYGSETVTFTAEDEGGEQVSDDVTFTLDPVNDPPVVDNIPGQTISEGNSFATFDLDNYVSDIDNTPAEISWSYSGQTELTVDIDGNHIATVSVPSVDWNGTETITFTATDPGMLSDSDNAIFTVTAVNDPPIISDIPNQTEDEGDAFSPINLNDYIDDVETDDQDILWNYELPNDPNLSVSISNQVATITPVDPDWNGTETITFTAEDEDGAEVSDDVVITVLPVNDLPVITNIPNQSANEGEPFDQIVLDNYIDDVETDDEDIIWTYELPQNPNLNVDITNRIATITPIDENWFGSETVTFTAEDEDGAQVSDNVKFTVIAVDDPPEILPFTVDPIDEGEVFPTIPLIDYLVEVDGELVGWSVKGNVNLDVTIKNGGDSAVVEPIDINWFGTEEIRFIVEDQAGELKDSIDVTFTVNNIDDAPIISPIPDQITQEAVGDQGGSYSFEFPEIQLMNYLTELDGDEVSWKLSTNTIKDEQNNTIFTFSIQQDTVLIATLVDDNWFGDTSIFVIAREDIDGTPRLTDTAEIVYQVVGRDDPPFVENPIANIYEEEDADNHVYNLYDVFEDVDDEDKEFELTIRDLEGVDLDVVSPYIEDSLLIIEFEPHAFGSASFTVRAKVNGKTVDEGINVEVSSVNDPPYFSLDTNYIIISVNQPQTRYVYSIPEWVEAETVNYSLSPPSISFANVSINSITGTITIQTIVDSTGQQEFTVIANDNQPENNLYEQTFTLGVNVKVNQSIEFESIPDITLATESYELQATATSGLPVSFEVLSGPATITGDNVLQINGIGNIEVRASQDGNDTFNPAPDVDQTFNVSKIPQSISYTPISDTQYGVDPIKLDVEASSGLPVESTVISGAAFIAGDSITVTGVGNITVRHSQPGNEMYQAADNELDHFFVGKASQSITFDTISNKTFGVEPFALSATATSGLTVTFSVLSGDAFVNGNVLTLTGTGDITVRARQSGNTLYLAATPIDQTFSVAKASQSVAFPSLSDRAFTTSPIPLNATSSSGLPVEYLVEGNAIVEEDQLTLTGIGDITLLAYQPGNQNYMPSDTTVESFNVFKASQSISFGFEDTVYYSLDPIDLNGMSSSGLPVSYEVTEGDGYIENGDLKPNEFGMMTVKAFQSGNDQYLSATPVFRSIEIRKPLIDGAITRIITPAYKSNILPDRPLEISIKVKNVGNIDINEMRLTYVVDDGAASSSELFRQHVASGDSVTYRFSNFWTPRGKPNTLCVYTEIENDTINGNDTICMDLTVGLNDLIYSAALIKNVYPNPANDIVTFDFGALDEKSMFMVYDSKGNLVKEIQLERNIREYPMYIRELADGMYFYKIVSSNRYYTGKFVKE